MAVHHTSLEPQPGITIKIPWDSNTFRGFVGALMFILLCVLVGPCFDLKPRYVEIPEKTTIPIEQVKLFFGDGTGPGASHGNFAEEGKKAKGKTTVSTLSNTSAPKHDIKIKTAKANVTQELSTKITPVKSKPDKDSDTKKKSNETENTSKKNTNIADNSSTVLKGDPRGDDNGTGKGKTGTGPGAGKGWGDIDWGGGGNTAVIHKEELKIPDGLNNSTVVKFRFTIEPNGDIGMITPLTRGIPIAESAAKSAFKKWKFKAPSSGTPLTGTITVRFEIN